MKHLVYKSNAPERDREEVQDILSLSKFDEGRFGGHPIAGRTHGECIQINGEWGCGKTLFLDFVAIERNAYEGLPVLSNYTLRGVKPWTQITDNIEILKKISNTIVEIDEIRRYMDSYLQKSKKQRFISNLCADLGKQSCAFYYTDQSPTAAPTRIRNNISAVCYPKLDEETNWVTVYWFYGITEYLMVEPFFSFGFYAPDYWWAYDTHQKIEDYKQKFDVKKYVIIFLYWRDRHGYQGVSGKLMNLWNLESGENLGRDECQAVLTYIDEEGIQ